ncbi:MAG TPA: precorrin-8X methylmutase [Nitrospirota bacterium]|nr:precorrin-8X methylmutase [Nitrospirota bacterium]
MSLPSDPREIEKKSFEIISALLEGKGLEGPERDVVMRVVHATADPEFADLMLFSGGAAKAGIEAVKSGCAVVTDVTMLKAGISRNRPGGREALCHIADPDVAEAAKKDGGTRAVAAMRKAAMLGEMDGAVVAIGNAPTALFELIRLIKDGKARPALVVGVPVGFVGASESKEGLAAMTGVPFITSRGRKGGSAVAAAIVNALIKLAGK